MRLSPLLQFIRTLSGKPGHALTFFRGELKQTDFDYKPTGPAQRSVPASLASDEAGIHEGLTLRRPARSVDRKKPRSEPSIPQTIRQFFTLQPVDREDILSRMPDKLRKSIEDGFIVDELGLHRRPSADLGINPVTWHGRMLKATQLIHERISVGADGTVSRILSNAEHNRLVFGIQSAPAVSEMSTLLTDFRGRSGKKKKKKKGWTRE